jgi:hypothetical protein
VKNRKDAGLVQQAFWEMLKQVQHDSYDNMVGQHGTTMVVFSL